MELKDLTPEEVEKLKKHVWSEMAKFRPNIPLITRPEKPSAVQRLMRKCSHLFGLRKLFRKNVSQSPQGEAEITDQKL